MPKKQGQIETDRNTLGLYARIATGLATQPAYLLVFAICALFFLSGTVTIAKAVVSNDFRFGILALISFVIATGAAIIIVREVERKAVPPVTGLPAHSNPAIQPDAKLERPVDTPRVGTPPEPLLPKDERALLAELPEWEIVETEDPFAEGDLRRELHRTYEFLTFDAAFLFMKQVVDRAILRLDHHPRWQNTFNRVEVWLTTFNLGRRLSVRDRKLAQLFEEIWKESTKFRSERDSR